MKIYLNTSYTYYYNYPYWSQKQRRPVWICLGNN